MLFVLTKVTIEVISPDRDILAAKEMSITCLLTVEMTAYIRANFLIGTRTKRNGSWRSNVGKGCRIATGFQKFMTKVRR